MKKLLLSIVAIAVLLSCDDGSEKWSPSGPQTPPPSGGGAEVVYAERAKEMFDLIQIHYKNGNSGLYKENNPAQNGDPAYSFLWPYDGLVSGAALLTQLGYEVGYESMVANFDKYWREGAEGNTIGGFGSSTDGMQGGGTRFYDDNSIVGISLVEAYELTENQAFLDRAKKVVQFLKSGRADDGVLWWNESQKDQDGVADSNKPSCANGYATQFLLKYYAVCESSEKSEVLLFAKQLYQWLKTNLKDADHCYWNDMNNKGVVNKTKWTYNTGVMVQNGICLYRITGDETFLTDAIASAQGAYDFFVKSRNGISLAYPDNDPWFNTKLLRAYIDLKPLYSQADQYIQTYARFMNNGHEKARTDLGFFYEDWTGADPKRYYSLLMQDAVVESYAAIALYNGENQNQ